MSAIACDHAGIDLKPAVIAVLDELGIPYEKINLDAVMREADRRYALQSGGLYALAMLEWAESYYSCQIMEQTEAAAGNGGCNFIQDNNSS